jgi:fatty-acyl-CoA synthase
LLGKKTIIPDAVREAEMKAELARNPRFIDLVAQGARLDPDATALIYCRGVTDPQPVELSFDMLMGLAKAASDRFAGLGLGPEDVVALLSPACPATVVAILGASAHSVAMPLNLLFTREAIVAQLNASRAKILVVPPPGMPGGLFEKVEGIRSEVPALDHVIVAPIDGRVMFDGETLAPDPAWRDAFDGSRATTAEAERVAVMLPTGGTTGHPKVARLMNRNCVASSVASRQAFDYRRSDRMMAALPLFHVGGLFVAVGAGLSAGSTVLIPSPASARDPGFVANFWKMIARFKLTHAGNVPTTLGAVSATPVGDADISTLRVMPTGAQICPPEIERRFLEVWGGDSLKQCYGMTELAGGIAQDFHDRPVKAGHVGTRNPLVELAVLAGGALHTQLPTPTGELITRGPQVFAGYIDAKQTKDAFHEGWLRTGDLCRIDADGYIEIMGRAKDVIIRGGHNIDPRAIEDAAMDFPGVALAAAVARPDAYAGEVPMLFVSTLPGIAIDAEELGRFVTERIPEPPARPRAVEVIDEMPVTPVGKIFKPKLREIASAAAAREILAAEGFGGAQVTAVTDPARGLVITAKVAGNIEKAKRLLETLPVRIVVTSA